MEKKKVIVGMSGGVDSSVCALLLKEQGYDVTGVTMQIWQKESLETVEENGGCCGLSAVEDARRIAAKIGVPYYVMNFRKEFQKHVIDYFVEEYKKGRTPNPCIACNRYIKWESLLSRALSVGADAIATGHYARIDTYEKTGRLALRLSKTAAKDQTYALYSLTQEQLQRTLMPLGAYEKQEVRQIAKDNGLFVFDKPDSQEICFVPDNDYAGFLERETGQKSPEGNFVDLAGEVLGKHKGIVHYTVGQRKGLGMTFGKPMYVYEIRPERNEVVLSSNEELFCDRLLAGNLNFMAVDGIAGEVRAEAKIRYSHKKAPCTLRMHGDGVLECIFDVPQRAITPGQAVVFYDGEFVLGGGTILRAL